MGDGVRSSQFGVLNNGVTIVVRSMVPSPTDVVLRGPRVVNGCQTCNVLELNREKLTDNVMVNIRIIESSDEEVVSAIVRATNRQTAINQDILTARDEFQREVEEFCASRPDDRDLYFERRLQQYGAKPRARVISRRHLIQSYAAMWLDSPHKVTRYQSLWAGTSGPIFDRGHDPLFYYLSAAAYLNVVRLIGRGVAPQYRPARFHLLYGLKLLAFGAGPVQLLGDRLDAASNRMLDVLWDQDSLRSVVGSLLPVLDRSLAAEVRLSGLNGEVRTEPFTARFQRALLESPLDGQPWPQVA